MRKLTAVLVLAFAMILGFGVATPDAANAAGDCYFTCSCSGQPLYCCTNASGSTSCKATDLFQCPQVYTC